MKKYDCTCPKCGTLNKDLYLEESNGFFVCEKCDETIKAMEIRRVVALPMYTPEQLVRAFARS